MQIFHTYIISCNDKEQSILGNRLGDSSHLIGVGCQM